MSCLDWDYGDSRPGQQWRNGEEEMIVGPVAGPTDIGGASLSNSDAPPVGLRKKAAKIHKPISLRTTQE